MILPPDGEVRDEVEYPLVPPGKYNAAYKTHSLFSMYGNAQKLRVQFTITDQDERNAFGITVPWFSNVKIISKKNRSWIAGRRSAFLETFCRLFPDYNPNKSKRIPMNRFHGRQFRIEVRTVTTNRQGEDKPEQLHYSKVVEVRCA